MPLPRSLPLPQWAGRKVYFNSPTPACGPQSHDSSMPTLILICGLPGAGKTTLAKKLEQEIPALRLCPDEWIIDIYGPDIDRATLDAARDPVEAALWKLAERALILGLNVIVEYGFWAREERESFRARAETVGAMVEL